MATSTVEKELIGLEHQYWQAIKDGDFNAALRLTDEPCVVAGAQGVAEIDKASFEKMMRAATYTLESFRLGNDIKVRMLSDDVAIVAYTVHEKLTVDGKPVTLEAADASTWIRRGDSWRCALHTESLHGDPFGRDRKKTATKKSEPS